MGGWGKNPRKRVAEPVDNVLSSNKFYFYAKKLWGEAKTNQNRTENQKSRVGEKWNGLCSPFWPRRRAQQVGQVGEFPELPSLPAPRADEVAMAKSRTLVVVGQRSSGGWN